MLIKSEALINEREASVDVDKLQQRLRQHQESENSSRGIFSTKNSTFPNDRKVNKSTSPLDITQISPYLLLCGAMALRGNILEDLNVSCVVNATKELPDTPLPSSLNNNILYLRVNVDDKSDSDILSWLDFVTDLIHQVRLAGGKSLIHCVAGISRSATLCLAYLIKYEGYSLYDSYILLKTLRENIRPNSGFFGQLIEFEKRITGKQTVFMIRSDYAPNCIPQLYEEDYYRLHKLRCQRT